MSELLVTSQEAFEILNQGKVLGLPTETVYGLAARIDNDEALNLIFTTKKRPLFDPLIVHVASLEKAKPLCEHWPKAAQILAEKFWPGPLTLVLKKSKQVSSLITADLDSVGLRCPNHPLSLELLKQLPFPLAAPSANRFGKTSPTTAEHVLSEFDNKVPVLDGGPCQVGIESTVVEITTESENQSAVNILRPGALGLKEIKDAFEDAGLECPVQYKSSPVAPGQLENHYQPEKPLILLTKGLEFSSEVKQFISEQLNSPMADSLSLNLPDAPELAARKLYSELRRLSTTTEAGLIFIEKDLHRSESWKALRDRIQKATTLTVSTNSSGQLSAIKK